MSLQKQAFQASLLEKQARPAVSREIRWTQTLRDRLMIATKFGINSYGTRWRIERELKRTHG
jgi:hypothetical protein